MGRLQNMRPKVLYLAGWYPNKENSVSGIFVKRYALAISKYCDVAVLYVHQGEAENCIEASMDDGIFEVIVYRNLKTSPNRIVRALASTVLISNLVLLLGAYQGFKVIRRDFGLPDISHLHVTFYIYLGLIALALRVLKDIPYIVTEHHIGYTNEENKFFSESIFVKEIIKFIGRNASTITTVSKSLMDDMARCGIKNTFRVIPNIIDGDFSYAERSANNRKKIMLHISLLNDAQKNVSGIIEAVNTLSKGRSDFELHIIGDGIDRVKLEGTANGYGLLNNTVFFHGRVDDQTLVRSMESCDFFVLFSNVETFSVVTAEALACGKPVIATKCGGPEEFVNGICGVLIEPRNTAALVKSMDYMLDNYQTYRSIDICEYARGKFSADIIGKDLFDIYRRILKWT